MSNDKTERQPFAPGDKVKLTARTYPFDEVGREATVVEDRGWLLRLSFAPGLAVDDEDGLDICTGDLGPLNDGAWSYYPSEVERA